MNKIDEQPARGSHAPEGGGVDASAEGASSLPGSQPITVEVAAFRELDQRSAPDDLLQTASSKTASRRFWLRRGVVAASPVVASLISAPVYAASACVLPSGFGSITTLKSRHPDAMVCTGQGPNFWANATNDARTGVKLKDAFSVNPNVEPRLTNPSLKEVLIGGSVFAKYSVAAYLNATYPPSSGFPLNPQQAKDVYTSYRPAVAVKAPLVLTWNEGQAIEWLQILMSP